MDKKNKNQQPTVAPGMDDDPELKEKATQEEIENGEYTSVTTFSWDEVDPS